MEEKSLSNLLSQLIPDDLEKSLGLGGNQSGQEAANLAGSLRSIAGQAGGPLEGAINEFLSGQGELHTATRAAASSGTTGVKSIIDLLTSRFKLSPAIANLIAPLLVKLLPALANQQSKETEKESGKDTAKPKPRKKPKSKSESSSKKETTSGKKKPKKEAPKKPKPAAKPAAKKKPAKKETVAKPKPKPKPAKRTGILDIDAIDIG